MDYDTYVTACYHEGVKPVSWEEFYRVNKPPETDEVV